MVKKNKIIRLRNQNKHAKKYSKINIILPDPQRPPKDNPGGMSVCLSLSFIRENRGARGDKSQTSLPLHVWFTILLWLQILKINHICYKWDLPNLHIPFMSPYSPHLFSLEH